MNIVLWHGTSGWSAGVLAVLGGVWLLSSGWERFHEWLDQGPRRLRKDSGQQRYAEARRALDLNAIEEVAHGVRRESPEFVSLNRAVVDAEAGVSWWRRALIDSRVRRELDCQDRMGGAA